MSIQTLEIVGLRCFGVAQNASFSLPNGKRGSGLTLFVGPNNGGKSTMIEALRGLAARKTQSFTVGKRNPAANDSVAITATDHNGGLHTLKTIGPGGSEAAYSGTGTLGRIFVLPSRRFFNPMFGKSEMSRDVYITNIGLPPVRGSTLDQFAYRLFSIHGDAAKRKQFDDVLSSLIQPLPEWTIDLSDGGQYFLKFRNKRTAHNSDGLGEGLVSCFFIADALYDSNQTDIIVIDEQELSLHPMLQRKVVGLLSEYASDRQIVLATHSPYFVDFEWVVEGAEIGRVFLDKNDDIQIRQLSRESVKRVEPFLRNRHNPHILGLDAREVFFLDDGIILVEGQDDVCSYPEVAKQLTLEFSGHFFGWGAGGAENMVAVASMLRDLGFMKVIPIFDGNKRHTAKQFEAEFPTYGCFVIDADDVRTKPRRKETKEVSGLLDVDGKLPPHYVEPVKQLVAATNEYLGC